MSPSLRFAWPLVFWIASGTFAAAAEPAPAARLQEEVAAGRALYLEGRRADGTPLLARRAGGLALAGSQAACVSCHRRSGLGGSEGRSYIPPITAASLFHAMPSGKGASAIGAGRPAYTGASIAHALRDGVDASGRPLDYLMPRYQLQDQEVKALVAYLRQLSVTSGPADDAGVLHFATILAPDVAPERGRAMLDVLQACFDEHNAGPPALRGRKRLDSAMSRRETQPWRLHAWTLQDAANTWRAQLEARAGRQPVFAVVGGVGGGNWAPVHAWCEQAGVPCLFPHVEAPVADAGAFYPLYLGKGVLLESGLVAARLLEQPARPRRLLQVLREGDDAARAGSQALGEALAGQGIELPIVRIPRQGTLDAGALAGVGAGDALMLWLRPGDLQRLEGVAAPAGEIHLSGTLAQSDAVPLPAAWKERALMAYPFELPQARANRMAPLRQWLRSHGIAPGDERVQADAFVACTALRTAMTDAEHHLGRDYLVERVEANMERGTLTGLYPRLALGAGQRFASKSGYLVRFDHASGQLLPAGERVAP
jgi:mono/diheme cytochrome c family protein